MPDQMFTYDIENPLVIISLKMGIGGVMVIRPYIEFWGIGKDGTKRGVWEK
jgi:hypothetical protein